MLTCPDLVHGSEPTGIMCMILFSRLGRLLPCFAASLPNVGEPARLWVPSR